MATWKDLLFGNLVGFSAFAAILLTLLIGVFFAIWFMKMSKPPADHDSASSKPPGAG